MRWQTKLSWCPNQGTQANIPPATQDYCHICTKKIPCGIQQLLTSGKSFGLQRRHNFKSMDHGFIQRKFLSRENIHWVFGFLLWSPGNIISIMLSEVQLKRKIKEEIRDYPLQWILFLFHPALSPKTDFSQLWSSKPQKSKNLKYQNTCQMSTGTEHVQSNSKLRRTSCYKHWGPKQKKS